MNPLFNMYVLIHIVLNRTVKDSILTVFSYYEPSCTERKLCPYLRVLNCLADKKLKGNKQVM
jgi:hypothetical protein